MIFTGCTWVLEGAPGFDSSPIPFAVEYSTTELYPLYQ